MDQIREVLRRHLPRLRKQYGIRSLEIFGSYAHGQQKKQSDLDLLIEFDDTVPLSLFDIAGIEYELSGLVGIPVDLVERNAIRPALRQRILNEAVSL
jgi:predicted nucleotidyltransferase